ncbi:hypothetical protein ABUW04_04545 [Streptacidiphilus sp. N1-10]|uniref:Uncharacterized protein n=1 Tax=Streptacidiphilus jeojiensis TaxID=3229225 RepID=A0ABV6XHG0_9ACTN
MSERNERLRESLRGLAATAAGEPPLSGAELRRRAERRRRPWVLGAPALALSGLLVGGTAFAISGALGSGPQRVPTVSAVIPTTSAPGTAPAAPRTTGPAEPRPSPTPSSAPDVAASTAAAPITPSGPSTAATSASSDPGKVLGCAVARTGETLERVQSLQLPAGLTPGVDALLYAVPVDCVRGQLVPSGTVQLLQVLPDAVVTTTAPLSTGTGSSVNTLTGLAAGLVLHPEQLFGVGRDAQGRVDRLDQIATGS